MIEVTARPALVAKLRLIRERTTELVAALERSALFIESVPERWSYARDPDDAHYVNLALAAQAELVVSRDNDLLALMDRQSPEGKNFAAHFPRLTILTPPAFLEHVEQVRSAHQGQQKQQSRSVEREQADGQGVNDDPVQS